MDSQLNEGGIVPDPPPSEYEVCAPGSFPSGQMAFVRAIHEKFLSAFAEDLSTRLEKQVIAELGEVQALSRSGFLESAEAGGCVLSLNAEPVRSQALVALSPGLVAYLLRLLLGAPANAPYEQRPVTDIEMYILRELFELLARHLTAAWKPAGVGFRWTPPGAGESHAWQGTMLMFECRLNFEDAQETFRIAAPAFLARLAALQAAVEPPEEVPAPVREMIFNALSRARVGVDAVLADSTLRMGDLLALEPGHILMLGQPAGSPVECHISGKKKFRGEWVGHGNRQALLIL